jgi:hypothetical protein
VLARAKLLVDLLGPIGWMSYILAATLNTADAEGFKEVSMSDQA